MLLSPIVTSLQDIYEHYLPLTEGNLASYIPELAKVNPNLFGICICTADGQIYEVGDSQHLFTIQSISKTFVYGLALADHGVTQVMKKVGVEPTGEAFNSIVFDEVNNRPYNPMVNAGAIATTALIKGNSVEERFSRILRLFEDFVGHPLTIDESVYQSESDTGHRNRAIAYLELNSGMIEQPIDEHLELYFRQCAILVSGRDLAVMSATLANNGINPITKKQVMEPDIVKSILSVMASCGMYNFSGEWIYKVGLPAKSGVGGGIIAVLPGQFGIGTFSPRLDKLGNSVRGLKVCEDISSRFNFHLFDTHTLLESVIHRQYNGAIVSSKKQRRQAEKEILEREGKQIAVFELQGDLYFSTMEKLFRYLENLDSETKYLILDGHYINNVNSSALFLLDQTKEKLSKNKITLIISNFDVSIKEKLQHKGWLDINFSVDLDTALEECENFLLSKYLSKKIDTNKKLSLSEMDLLLDFTPQEINIIEPLFDEINYQEKDSITTEGEEAHQIFFLASGTATVYLKLLNSDKRRRLTTYISGTCFGELALFDRANPSENIIADNNLICYVLDLKKINVLINNYPEIYVKLLERLGKNLVKTLRRNSAEIKSFSGVNILSKE
jgi:glutaminase